MPLKVIDTKNAPTPIGPYSQAVICGPFLFCSGQIGLDVEKNQLVSENIKDQTVQVFKNIEALLLAAHCTFADVIKATIFLKDIGDFVAVNELYQTYFKAPYPARSTVEVARLPRDAKVEIEIIASFKNADT